MHDLHHRLSAGVSAHALVARQDWSELQIEQVLGVFDPVDVSSISSGLGVPDSDLDIVCDTRPGDFVKTVRQAYGGLPHFQTWLSGQRTMVSFAGPHVGIEISAEPKAVEAQQAYRHAVAQRRAAEAGGVELIDRVRRLRLAQGLKTEPALAKVLDLPGDPYQAVDRLAEIDDTALRTLIQAALQRFGPARHV